MLEELFLREKWNSAKAWSRKWTPHHPQLATQCIGWITKSRSMSLELKTGSPEDLTPQEQLMWHHHHERKQRQETLKTLGTAEEAQRAGLSPGSCAIVAHGPWRGPENEWQSFTDSFHIWLLFPLNSKCLKQGIQENVRRFFVTILQRVWCIFV